MGLDAVLYCDCVETNRLAIPHPYPRLLYVGRNGAPEIRSKDKVKIDQHYDWLDRPPCKHDQMMLDGCSLGNSFYVLRLRDIVASFAAKHGQALPVLLKGVLYNGTHTGDYLTVNDVGKLSCELDSLKGARFSRTGLVLAEDAREISKTMRALRRLVKKALMVNKPIAF
jgi:hypothetical protein